MVRLYVMICCVVVSGGGEGRRWLGCRHERLLRCWWRRQRCSRHDDDATRSSEMCRSTVDARWQHVQVRHRQVWTPFKGTDGFLFAGGRDGGKNKFLRTVIFFWCGNLYLNLLYVFSFIVFFLILSHVIKISRKMLTEMKLKCLTKNIALIKWIWSVLFTVWFLSVPYTLSLIVFVLVMILLNF